MNSKDFFLNKRTYSSVIFLISALYTTFALADEQPDQTITVPAITMTAKRLDEARNSILPDTGSSIYRFDQATIEDMPLGSSTP